MKNTKEISLENDVEKSIGGSQTQSTDTLDVIGCKNDDEYNPLEHRAILHPTSTCGSFFHLLKSCLGSGLLAMPAAFKHSGIIPGCFGTAIVAGITTHCVQILVETSRSVCRESHVASLTYTETCEQVFKHGPKRLQRYSNVVRHFVDYAMAGVCLGGTSVYVIFIASTIKDLCDNIIQSHGISVQNYCWMLLLPLILITQVRFLKFLVPFSVIANLSMVVTFGITCYYTLMDLQIREPNLSVSITEWPLFLSTAIFAMEGINVVMPIENEMANPKDFLGCPGVLNLTMGLVAVLYGFVGFCGYLKYGDLVKGSVTLNLPQDKIPAITAKILVTVAVFFTYCLQMYAPMDIIWSRLRDKVPAPYHNIAQISLRTLSVSLTVILAVAVPDLELLIGLVGAIFLSTLGLFIPVVIETVYKWENHLGKYFHVLWKNILLLIFYLLVLTSGCYSAVREIVLKY